MPARLQGRLNRLSVAQVAGEHYESTEESGTAFDAGAGLDAALDQPLDADSPESWTPAEWNASLASIERFASARSNPAPVPPAAADVAMTDKGEADNISIRRAFDGRRVLLTGGTGFVGMVTLETLLRETDVAEVVVLAREGRKRRAGTEPKEVGARIRALVLTHPLFATVRDTRPDMVDRVSAVKGDINAPGLGLDAADLVPVLADGGVHFIIHTAASIKLGDKGALPTQVQFANTYVATGNLLLLGEKMPNMAEGGLVHVSTTYVNDNRPFGSTTTEKIYPLFTRGRFPTEEFPFSDHYSCVKHILGLAPDEARAKVMRLREELGFDCTYFLTKHLTEQLVAANHLRFGFPTAILRPAVIGGTALGPLPGFIGNNAGATGLALLLAGGVIDFTLYPPSQVMDLVPCDFVCNNILLAGAAMQHKPTEKCRVLQACTSTSNPISVGRFFDLVVDYFSHESLPDDVWRNLTGKQRDVAVKKVKYKSGFGGRVAWLGQWCKWKVLIAAARVFGDGLKLMPPSKVAKLGWNSVKLFLRNMLSNTFFSNACVRELAASLPAEERRSFPQVFDTTFDWARYLPLYLAKTKELLAFAALKDPAGYEEAASAGLNGLRRSVSRGLCKSFGAGFAAPLVGGPSGGFEDDEVFQNVKDVISAAASSGKSLNSLGSAGSVA